jgi:hypothetical protein
MRDEAKLEDMQISQKPIIARQSLVEVFFGYLVVF